MWPNPPICSFGSQSSKPPPAGKLTLVSSQEKGQRTLPRFLPSFHDSLVRLALEYQELRVEAGVSTEGRGSFVFGPLCTHENVDGDDLFIDTRHPPPPQSFPQSLEATLCWTGRDQSLTLGRTEWEKKLRAKLRLFGQGQSLFLVLHIVFILLVVIWVIDKAHQAALGGDGCRWWGGPGPDAQ